MRLAITLGCAIFGLAAASSAAYAVNICKTETMSCATTMPVGGYCECTSKGNTEGGSVTPKPAPHTKINATAGGCGVHPNAPGC
jgi:hypothetical protein